VSSRIEQQLKGQVPFFFFARVILEEQNWSDSDDKLRILKYVTIKCHGNLLMLFLKCSSFQRDEKNWCHDMNSLLPSSTRDWLFFIQVRSAAGLALSTTHSPN